MDAECAARSHHDMLFFRVYDLWLTYTLDNASPYHKREEKGQCVQTQGRFATYQAFYLEQHQFELHQKLGPYPRYIGRW